MTVYFYMNDQGEVLDNVKHPVNSPMLMVPVLPRLSAFKEPPESSPLEITCYRAIKIEVPDKPRE